MGGLVPPNPKSWQKLSKKNGVKLVGYTFRLENYLKSLELPLPYRTPFCESMCLPLHWYIIKAGKAPLVKAGYSQGAHHF